MAKNNANIPLMPGNPGRDCLCDGEHGVEICCDECDYLKCCLDETYPESCKRCTDTECPRQKKKTV